MGEVTNMFDLNKLHLEDELNEDVSFEEGLAEYVKNTKDASVDTLAEEFKDFPMFTKYIHYRPSFPYTLQLYILCLFP